MNIKYFFVFIILTTMPYTPTKAGRGLFTLSSFEGESVPSKTLRYAGLKRKHYPIPSYHNFFYNNMMKLYRSNAVIDKTFLEMKKGERKKINFITQRNISSGEKHREETAAEDHQFIPNANGVDIKYEIIREEEKAGIITSRIAENFFLYESMLSNSGLSKSEIADFFINTVMTSIKKGLLLQASIKDEIVGAVVNTDLFDDMDSQPLDPMGMPKARPVLGLIEQLEEPFIKKYEPIKLNTFLHIYLVYTERKWTGNNIATTLFLKTEELAKRLGYKNLISEVTGKGTQHITINKLNYHIEGSVSYKDFLFEGIKPFSQIKEPDSCILVMKEIYPS